MDRPTRPPVEWARDFFTFGVTGTNGKTSTVQLLSSIVAASGQPVLTVNTLGYFLDGEALPFPRSGRGFVDALIRLRDAGGRWAAVECTSKSLAEGYAARWRFDLGVFTNLSADHLQTHGTMEAYRAAKAQLFAHLGPGRTAVLNAADPESERLDESIPADVRRRWYGSPTRGPLGRTADLVAESVTVDPSGTRVRLCPSPWADALGGELHVRMVGEVYAENAMAAGCAGLAAGFTPQHVRAGLAACTPVTGRFEIVASAPLVVIDYAHSPDALARTCDTARQLAGSGRVLVVFGAGGESSPDKREPMGRVVGSRADIAVVTNDNPRREDPQAIAAMLVEGLACGGRARVETCLDRVDAIGRALQLAASEDVVVIAGKGHETGQDEGGDVRPHSDHDVVRGLTDRPDGQ